MYASDCSLQERLLAASAGIMRAKGSMTPQEIAMQREVVEQTGVNQRIPTLTGIMKPHDQAWKSRLKFDPKMDSPNLMPADPDAPGALDPDLVAGTEFQPGFDWQTDKIPIPVELPPVEVRTEAGPSWTKILLIAGGVGVGVLIISQVLKKKR